MAEPNYFLTCLGIDPGSHRIGYAILTRSNSKKYSLNLFGTIEVPPKTKSPESLQIVRNELTKILDDHNITFASVENLYFAQNKTTAQAVYETRGVILLTIGERNLKIVQPSNTQVKKAVTGNGNADKDMVKRGIEMLLGLKDLKGLDDSIDAIANAYVGFSLL